MQQLLTSEVAAQELLNRRQARKDFASWCRLCGWEPAKHHLLVTKELQSAIERYKEGHSTNLMILMPPGSAKSTYTSKLFPPWFLAQSSQLAILACSHQAELATEFGRAGRNLVDTYHKVLGYDLAKDSRAADSWELTNGGYYRAAGCGAGISGRRADLGLIDDFCGSEEDAGSKLFNDKIWNWYINDFIPRLKPNAVRIIIANHRNEDDLCGRLLSREADKWRVIRLRLLIETQEQADEDPLRRKTGEWLWPEYFTKELVQERMTNPRASGLEQQEPSPEKGNFFQSEQFLYYDSLPEGASHYYFASDHAVSEKQTADLTCLIGGLFNENKLYIIPDIIWDRINTKQAVEEILKLAKKYHPLYWWAEKGQISRSIGPFLQDRMMDEHTFANIVQVVPAKDKMSRAQTIQGMMSMGMVLWPKAHWVQRAKKELLTFPNGKHDDLVDALAHLGRGIHQMISVKSKKEIDLGFENKPGFNITPRILKEQQKKDQRALRLADR